ncbi:MAG: hypothetical protein JWO63_1897 [Frankiales bacterium]|jgi:hypothetical protein|nr:hypothetical protein [Frankiales bacterium]
MGLPQHVRLENGDIEFTVIGCAPASVLVLLAQHRYAQSERVECFSEVPCPSVGDRALVLRFRWTSQVGHRNRVWQG